MVGHGGVVVDPGGLWWVVVGHGGLWCIAVDHSGVVDREPRGG